MMQIKARSALKSIKIEEINKAHVLQLPPACCATQEFGHDNIVAKKKSGVNKPQQVIVGYGEAAN